MCKEIFGRSCGIKPDTAHYHAISIISRMIVMAWDRAMKREPRLRAKLEEAERNATDAWTRFQSLPVTAPNAEKLKTLRSLFKIVKAQCDLLKSLGEDGVLEAEAREEEVKQMMESVKGKRKYCDQSVYFTKRLINSC